MSRFRRLLALAIISLTLLPAFAVLTPRTSRAAYAPPLYQAEIPGGVQGFLEQRGSVLATYKVGEQSASEIIEGYTSYYSLDPRVLLTLLELLPGLVSAPQADEATLSRPFGSAGPAGFKGQVEWAVRQLRAGYGPYDQAPSVTFADGKRRTLDLSQQPELLAIGRFLAPGRSEAEWSGLLQRYSQLYASLFGATPQAQPQQAPARHGFLNDPWPTGTEVIHTSWFDHAYPMVDVHGDGNETMVDYLGRGGLSYNSHDGHDFYFPQQPYGTPILAAASGWAFARTTRGLGVVIQHAGAYEGYESVYWHLMDFTPIFKDRIDSDEAVWVEAGTHLGWSGATGFTDGAPHLHFEVRHNGKQVDPFGWYGPGDDPCAQYAACERSVWLWSERSVWHEPNTRRLVDNRPPEGLLTVNPDPSLALLVHFERTTLPEVASGMSISQRMGYEDGRFGSAVRSRPEGRLSYPAAGNLNLAEGTLAFWVKLPAELPELSTGRNYLVAASSHPDDPAGVYSETFALRHEAPRGDRPALWNFWTVDGGGVSQSLTTTAVLTDGWHHVALTWSLEEGRKALYFDGRLEAEVRDAALPSAIEGRLELGRWYLESGVSDASFDELALWRRALAPAEITRLSDAVAPQQATPAVLTSTALSLITPAQDDGGGIVQVQLGIDGRYGQPQPYYGAYRWRLPEVEGPHTISVRYGDRAGNTTVITREVTLDLPPRGSVSVTAVSQLTATLALSATDATSPISVLVSQDPQGSGGSWAPLAPTVSWRWNPRLERVLYVRFRDGNGRESSAIILGTPGQAVPATPAPTPPATPTPAPRLPAVATPLPVTPVTGPSTGPRKAPSQTSDLPRALR